MVNSTDINALRKDVIPNAKAWIAECKANGLDIEISNTVRDNEYQAYIYAQGRSRPGRIVTNGKTTTFHGAGLAIDFYSKSKRWGDHDFFVRCAAIAKKYGFSWAGDWKKFTEYCHIQWDNHRKSNHKNAPQMPLYQNEEKEIDDDMTQDQFNQMMDNYLAERAKQEPSDWSEEARKEAEAKEIIVGDERGNKQYKSFVTREQMVQFAYNVKHEKD